MLEAARLVPADAVAFDDELSATPAALALSVEELTAMKEEVEQIAAAQPWANHRDWMGKAIESAIAIRSTGWSSNAASCFTCIVSSIDTKTS